MRILRFRPQEYSVFGCNPHRGVSPDEIIKTKPGLLQCPPLSDRYANSQRSSQIIHAIFVELHDRPTSEDLESELNASISDPEWFLPDACEVTSFIIFNLSAFPNQFPERLVCGFSRDRRTSLVLKRSGWDNQATFKLEEDPISSVTEHDFIMVASEIYNPTGE